LEIAFNLQVTFGSAAIFTILILLVYDHGVSFYLLISSLIFFPLVICTVNYMSFPCFVNFCVVLEIEVRAYTFSHSTNPFCGGFCQDKVSPTIHPGLNLNGNPPDICFSNSENDRLEPPEPGSFVKFIPKYFNFLSYCEW
jgi:hypothetical protein